MSYAGVARTDSEREQALMLAAASFFSPGDSQDAAVSRKETLLREHPGYTNDSPIIVSTADGSLAGSAFLIDCLVPVEDRLLQGVFVSSVSVAESARGQGLSLLLMKAAIKAAKMRGADIAMVIARRAVDGYYTRFGFWGLSQYSKITLKMDMLSTDMRVPVSVGTKPVTAEDFKVCATLHGASYENLVGHCLRRPEMWNYILHKLPYLGMRLDLIVVDGETAGYAIHDGKGNLHEVATVAGAPVCSPRTLLEACAPGSESVTLHIPPTHPFLTGLEGADVSLTLRECPYGGHMVRILNPALPGSLRQSIADGGDTVETHLSFAETARCLRLSRVTNFDSAPGLGLRGSFNIPLLDQI